jgi:Tol biopolymer transport system component
MTTRGSDPSMLAEWLHEQAGRGAPDYLEDVLDRTQRTRQRPAWSSLERWLPMDLTIRTRTIFPPNLARLVVVAILALAIAAAAIWFAGSRVHRVPPPFGPAMNGAITSWSNGDIFISDADGTHLRPLVSGPTTDEGPLHTRDGTRLAFWRILGNDQSQLMMGNADGTDIQPVGAPLTKADWYEFSPGDDRLAIVHSVNDRRVLSILDVAHGATLTTLSVPGLEVDNDVFWRATSGAELIFTARPVAEQAGGSTGYAIHPDGTGLRPILREATVDWGYQGINLSPDGRWLAYWQYEPDSSADSVGAHNHLVDLMTGLDRRMTFDPTAEDESDLSFAPDGVHGLIVRAGTAATSAQLMYVRLDGTEPGRLLGPTFRGDEPKAMGFSPDGTFAILAFDGARPSFFDVATGQGHTGDSVVGTLASWQRLALP